MQSHSEAAQGSAGPEAQRTLEQMGNTTPPLGGVNKVLVTLRGHPTASSNDRPSGREDAPASECAPEKYQPRMRRRQGSRRSEHAIRADGGRWAETVWGLPTHRGLRHSQQGSWRPTELGAPRRSPRGKRAPSRCALHREVSETRSSGLNITRRNAPNAPTLLE